MDRFAPTLRVLNRALATSVLCLSLGCLPALAQADAAPKSFNIPAQKLSSALLAFSAQSGLDVVGDSKLIAAQNSFSLVGAFTPEQALTKLLDGTGLRFERIDEHTARVVAADGRGSSLKLVPVPANVRPLPMPSTIQAAEDLIVVGSRLQMTGQGATPVVTVTRAAIESSGVESVAQVLNNLPQVSTRSSTSPSQASRGLSTVLLRGLPSGTTLTLLDGRRIAGSASQAEGNVGFNLNLLPLAAVERLEILPGGSSAVYGGDALAGIVNIVLKKNLEEGAVDLRYGSADGYIERQATLAWGKTFGRAHLTVLAEYDSNTALKQKARALTRTTDTRAFGGTLLTFPYSSPGNIYSLNGQAIPGLGATSAGIPAGTSGVGLTAANFLATAGRPNTSTTFVQEASMVPSSKQYGGIVYGTIELAEHVEAYANLLYSHRLSPERDYEYYAAGQNGSVVIPASNPFNPFGVPLGFNYQFKGAGAYCFCVTQQYGRGVLGLRGTLLGWDWDIGLTHTRSRDDSDEDGIDAAKLNAALADTNPATALNPFADRSWSTAQVQAWTSHRLETSTLATTLAEATLRRTVLTLPAGDVRLSLGGEYGYQDLDLAVSGNKLKTTRSVQSGFGELRVPLLGAEEENGAERIVLSGAVRYDHYDDFGSRVSPQAGLEIRPVQGVLLRANYSGAFKPPSLYQLNRPTVLRSAYTPIVDRSRSGESYYVDQESGGNRGLKALTGESTSFGFVLTPAVAPGLEISVSKWSVKIDNYASTINTQTMADNESLFPQYVLRGPATAADLAAGRPGRISLLRSVVLNFGKFDLAGVDIAMRWPFTTSIGQFIPSISATNTYRYNSALIPGAPKVQRAGNATSGGFAPKWKAQASLGWNTEEVETLFVGNYVSAYQDYAPSTRRLGDFWTFDANARLTLAKIFAAAPKGAYVSVGMRNMFDRLPDYATFNGGLTGYDPTQYDIIGRYAYLQLGLKF